MSNTEHRRTPLTVDETAARLRLGVSTVRRKIASGELPAVQLGGKRSPVRRPAAPAALTTFAFPTASATTMGFGYEPARPRPAGPLGAALPAVVALPAIVAEGTVARSPHSRHRRSTRCSPPSLT
jgi:excisionase family DNA binding protein